MPLEGREPRRPGARIEVGAFTHIRDATEVPAIGGGF